MDKQEFMICFEGLSSAEASVEAQRLQEMLAGEIWAYRPKKK